MKAKLLFVDDRARRIREAIAQYGVLYDLTIAPNVPEALKAFSGQEFDIVSLDHDLGAQEFQDTDAPDCAMEIIRYIRKNGWPGHKRKPEFWVHSYNAFAAHNMLGSLQELGFIARLNTLRYPKYACGLIAGCFDVIHPGYIRLFQEAKHVCGYLIVALHVDPSLENPEKLKPVLSVEERTEILYSIRYVDEVIPYRTEDDLDVLLHSVDVRIVGSDHEGHTTRPGLMTPTHYHVREHEWSSSRYKHMIAESLS